GPDCHHRRAWTAGRAVNSARRRPEAQPVAAQLHAHRGTAKAGVLGDVPDVHAGGDGWPDVDSEREATRRGPRGRQGSRELLRADGGSWRGCADPATYL